MIKLIYQCVMGPELFRIYRNSLVQNHKGRNYQPNSIEFYSNSVVSFFRGLYTLCKWTSPMIVAFVFYRYRGVPTPTDMSSGPTDITSGASSDSSTILEGLGSLVRLFCALALVFGTALIGRGVGRVTNKDYKAFIAKFVHLNDRPANENAQLRKKFLREHDFEMKYWKCDFVAESLPPKFVPPAPHSHCSSSSALNDAKLFVWRFLGHICVDTFGLRMTYPGTVVQNLIGQVLLENRTKFIEKKAAQRALIGTNDSYQNKIDTLFIDQREKNSQATNKIEQKRSGPGGFATLSDLVSSSDDQSNQDATNKTFMNTESNGKYLVLCCDGNASFYEVGIFQIPIENGFSCLGWNYPGFGHSTGSPYPAQVTAAADAVVQYAHSLGFRNENIILFSWSIGGFAASWLAKQYPDMKGVILDAAFDHIVPLAQQRMPSFASTFVDYVIRSHLNLDVAEQIKHYPGPVTFVRRTFDEIIATVPRQAASNRGNDLMISTLSVRYPHLVDEKTLPYLRTYLAAKSPEHRIRIVQSYSESSSNEAEATLLNYLTQHGREYPFRLGKNETASTEDSLLVKVSSEQKLTLALYLASKYLRNYESMHCNPLPREFVTLPWTESDLLC